MWDTFGSVQYIFITQIYFQQNWSGPTMFSVPKRNTATSFDRHAKILRGLQC